MKKLMLYTCLCFSTFFLYGQDVHEVFIQVPNTDISEFDSEILGQKLRLDHTLDKKDFKAVFKANGIQTLTYNIETSSGEGIVVFFDKLILGEGTQIRAYSPDKGSSTRYFKQNNNTNTKSFALPYIKGNHVVIEITCNGHEAYNFLEVEVSEVGVLYSVRGFGDAPSCFVNINCSEGEPWQDQKRSVAKYMTVAGSNIGYCTGSLINNTDEDCKNYFLSAQHCGFGSSAADLGQYVFYFNYEAEGCTNPENDNGLDQQTVVGCTKLAESGESTSFPDRSDFLLVELTSIPSSYNVYYAGWNRASVDLIQGDGAIIQHPRADLKKIAFWDNAQTSATSFDHLEINCIESANGDGIVEPNSSGSPVFDINHNIIGNVTAGSSGCISQTIFPTTIAGKFEMHWDQCGTSSNRQLKPWLDPTNSGVMSLNGKNQCGSVGIGEKAATIINIFPNPATQYINIVTDETIEMNRMYTIDGKILLETEISENIDVSKLPSGPILIEVIFKTGEIAHNIIFKE
jgi:hypothetical protein